MGREMGTGQGNNLKTAGAGGVIIIPGERVGRVIDSMTFGASHAQDCVRSHRQCFFFFHSWSMCQLVFICQVSLHNMIIGAKPIPFGLHVGPRVRAHAAWAPNQGPRAPSQGPQAPSQGPQASSQGPESGPTGPESGPTGPESGPTVPETPSPL